MIIVLGYAILCHLLYYRMTYSNTLYSTKFISYHIISDLLSCAILQLISSRVPGRAAGLKGFAGLAAVTMIVAIHYLPLGAVKLMLAYLR